MSAPRLISPLLDNFIMGEPIFDQGGVRILPAMEQGSEAKYIVKIISIPATQSQVDALLITGAYQSADAVNGYFAELADSVIQEAGVLTQLSNAGGFDGYINTQVVPMDDGNGYDVYLLAPYRPTWDRISQQKAVTHLDGYNLALDVCAALSIARRNGYLYTNLKPESISVSASGSYHICDLGLTSLNYLQYGSLPSAYFSAYTAPEVADAYSSLNNTMDVYALGMMLYEIFNGGLPFTDRHAEATEYPAPAYAEEEFAQIILKAIAPDPAARWQDPTLMGQAIVNVMQRNGVSDAPIVPIIVPPIEENVEPDTVDDGAEVTESLNETEETAASEEATEAVDTEQIPEEVGAISMAEISEEVAEESVDNPAEDEEAIPADGEEASETAIVCENTVCSEQSVITDDSEDAEFTENASLEESANIDEESTDDEIPVANDDADNELDGILEEAAQLIGDIQSDAENVSENVTYEQLIIDETSGEPSDMNESSGFEDPEDNEQAPVHKRSGKRIAVIICSVVLLALLIVGGLFFYRHIYLQQIDILSVSGKADAISVAVVTDVPSDKLHVVCTDANGNTFEAELVNYKATITGLAAETNYTVALKIDGFHKLIGQTEYSYTTPEKTIISDLVVLNGTETGTAVTNFKLEGPNEGNWTVTFTSADEAPHSATAIDGTAIVTGLTIGKTYNVTISSSADLYLDEYVELTFTPGPVIKPISPYVDSCMDGKLTVKWSVPDNVDDQSWIVRCYNEDGFDETITTTEATAIFNVPDAKKAYNIEISAKGQAAKEQLAVTENSITLSDFTVDTSLPGRITLNWTASGDIPAEGYAVTYTVDGVQVAEAVKTNSNSLTILSAVPNAEHVFTFAGANGESVLCEPVAVTATGENPFNAFGIKASNMRFNLCLRPSKANWTYKDVSASSYTTTFSVGQKAGVTARILSKYYTSTEKVATVYVFRNADNAIIHTCSTEEVWGNMWVNGYGTFDIPSLPNTPGAYTLDMYIDGGLAYHSSITIK